MASYYAKYLATGERYLLGGKSSSESCRYGAREDCEARLAQVIAINAEFGIECKGKVHKSHLPPEIFAHCPGFPAQAVGCKCFGCRKLLTAEDAEAANQV